MLSFDTVWKNSYGNPREEDPLWKVKKLRVLHFHAESPDVWLGKWVVLEQGPGVHFSPRAEPKTAPMEFLPDRERNLTLPSSKHPNPMKAENLLTRGLAWSTLVILGWVLAMFNAAADGANERDVWRRQMMPIVPREYLCRYTGSPLQIDGILDEAAWATAPWTSDFVDIQGATKAAPPLRTRAKVLWDKDYLYIAAELAEPHVWATVTKHDAVIFQDPDFEIFIDPDGDTHNYYEFEINALNTSWDLLLDKPYQDKGKAHNEWEISGLKSAVHVQGTLNDPSDVDEGWTVEIAFPWKVLAEYARHAGAPVEREQWRIDFSRVEWQVRIKGNKYEKVPNRAEDNWVWSPQGVIDMHRPEMWGLLQFTRQEASDLPAVAPLPAKPARDLALEIYYAQRDFWKSHSRWAASLAELGLGGAQLPPGVALPTLELSPGGYTCAVGFKNDQGQHIWRIRQDRLLRLD